MYLALYVLMSVMIVYFCRRFMEYRRRGGVPLPPGPHSDPLLGHLRIAPRKNQEDVFYEWSKVYGDVIYLNVLGKSIVVLNSERAANDLLEKRSAIYSDRPWFPMHELLGWTNLLVFLQYGENFHKTRRLFQQLFTRKGCIVFQDIQLNQRNVLLKSLLETPDEFEAHVRRYTTSITMEIAYGHRIQTNDDYYLHIAESINNVLAGAGDAGTSPIDFFPFLRHLPAWFPGAWFIRYGRDNKALVDDMQDFAFGEVRKSMAAGTAEASFLSMHLEELAREGTETQEEFQRLKLASSHIYGAGGETTWSAIENFIFFMLLNPDVQKKAQREIDNVTGGTRLPDFSDRESLFYIDCVVQECMRWRPAVPLGIPHRVMADDIYRGMFIPKGSTIIANARGMTMDEELYHKPHLFHPERFLPKPEGLGEPFPNSTFGFGRRVCPGRHLAEASLWLTASTILSTFDIVPVKDSLGEYIIPKAEFVTSLTTHPKPFKCDIRPRSAKARSLVEML